MIYASITAKIILTAAVLTSLIAPAKLTGQSGDSVSPDPVAVVEDSLAAEVVNQEEEEHINTSYGAGDCFDYESLVRSYDWPVDTVLEICRKESGGNANAVNPEPHKDRQGNVICSSSRGLMQIACVHVIGSEHTLEDLHNPEVNIAIAYKIWKSSGFYPWTTYDDRTM